MKHWLIRKPDQRIFRPISEKEIIHQIESGLLLPQDEICPSEGYWFAIGEFSELHKHFQNIQLEKLFSRDISEVTSTIDPRQIVSDSPLKDNEDIRSDNILSDNIRIDDDQFRSLWMIVILFFVFLGILAWIWSD